MPQDMIRDKTVLHGVIHVVNPTKGMFALPYLS